MLLQKTIMRKFVLIVYLHKLVAQALDHAEPHLFGEVLVLSDAVYQRAQREGHGGKPLANLAEDRPGGLKLSEDITIIQLSERTSHKNKCNALIVSWTLQIHEDATGCRCQGAIAYKVLGRAIR